MVIQIANKNIEQWNVDYVGGKIYNLIGKNIRTLNKLDHLAVKENTGCVINQEI